MLGHFFFICWITFHFQKFQNKIELCPKHTMYSFICVITHETFKYIPDTKYDLIHKYYHYVELIDKYDLFHTIQYNDFF